jgi:hypothetical protein
MDLQQAASVLGADHIEYLIKRPLTVVKTRRDQAFAAGNLTHADAYNAVILRMEHRPVNTAKRPAPAQPMRPPKVVEETIENGRTISYLEYMLEKLICGLEINHNEQTLFNLAYDFAQMEHESAGQ